MLLTLGQRPRSLEIFAGWSDALTRLAVVLLTSAYSLLRLEYRRSKRWPPRVGHRELAYNHYLRRAK
jgi:hypothetical protein